MTEPDTAQQQIAGTLTDLSEQTRRLVHQEIDAARRETVAKAKHAAPGLALLGGAGVFAVFATAAAYRTSVRLLERALPPSGAALLATVGYGAAAGAAAAAGLRRLRDTPMPFPTETAQETRAAVTTARP